MVAGTSALVTVSLSSTVTAFGAVTVEVRPPPGGLHWVRMVRSAGPGVRSVSRGVLATTSVRPVTGSKVPAPIPSLVLPRTLNIRPHWSGSAPSDSRTSNRVPPYGRVVTGGSDSIPGVGATLRQMTTVYTVVEVWSVLFTVTVMSLRPRTSGALAIPP